MSHGIKKLTEDNFYRYYLSEHGIRVVPHSEEWSGYYRLGDRWQLILTSFCYGIAPEILTIPIRSYEDLEHVARRCGA